MNFDSALMKQRIDAVLTRTGNMSEESRRTEIEAHLEADWNEIMGKVPSYLAGRYLVEGRIGAAPGWFNAISLGNWLTIAEYAGVLSVPAKLLGTLDPMICTIMTICGNRDGFARLSDDQRMLFMNLIQAVNCMKRSEILRFDCCAMGRMKFVVQENGVPDASCRGIVRMGPLGEGGFDAPDFEDARFQDQMMWYTDQVMPVWSRPWIKAMRIPAATSPMMPNLQQTGTRAVEWRFYIRTGEIVAASQYYPHAPITESEARGRYGLDAAEEACRRMLHAMNSLSVLPHHPRYELRDDLDTAETHCTIDFLITPNGTPMLLEAGPAHLRNPNWGSHPCNFGSAQAPAGIALAVAA